jgi:hypothetical protein
MPPFAFTIAKYAFMPSTSGAKLPTRLFVFDVIVATLISLSETPGDLFGRFFWRSAALNVDVGPVAVGACVSEVFDDPALLHAAPRSIIAIATAPMRALIASPRKNSSTED